MAYLALIRHGKSEWNKLGQWTGLTDVGLVEEGVEEARRAGEALRDVHFDRAYVSALKRAQQTLAAILETQGQKDLPTTVSAAINERDYGDYTAKNKWQVKEQIGEEAFQALRRGWDVPVPNGESLKDVYARVAPYYESEILPHVERGENVLVVAHGNSLRALVKYLEKIPDDKVAELEIPTGEVNLFQIDPSGAIENKEIRAANPNRV